MFFIQIGAMPRVDDRVIFKEVYSGDRIRHLKLSLGGGRDINESPGEPFI